MKIDIRAEGGEAKAVTVNMGQPDFTPANVPILLEKSEIINQEIEVEGKKIRITSMLMGVPHTVVFVDSLEDDTVMHMGKLIENSSYFPSKTNVNFVQVINRDNIILRTWERGAGYTYACGTGACASVVAGIVNNLTNEKARVQLRGGDLLIKWKNRGTVYMEGPAAEVFEGIYPNY
jgi:diaminopimelate epimerase